MRCEFIDPTDHHRCGEKARTRILFIDSLSIHPVVRVACDRHGDMRFTALSNTEIEINKRKDENRISWTDFSDRMRVIRWGECRKCFIKFNMDDSNWIIEFFAIKRDTQIRMRRSFRVHSSCGKSELSLFTEKKDLEKNKRIDTY